ncbi:MAG: DUF2147 domain-containing protein [Bacteroidales bacterium]|nr:DUF2147 domain-containing protein [Bacteroidales bacterium]
MKKLFLLLAITLAFAGVSMAQNVLNNNGDNIVGTYQGKQGDDLFKAAITKQANGNYQGQIIWLEHDRDANGNKLLDEKNPDKSLRNVPCDQIVIFSDLKYDAKHQRWDDTKIYDPQRGIRANLRVEFTDKGQLKLRGSVMGIGESVYWDKIK